MFLEGAVGSGGDKILIPDLLEGDRFGGTGHHAETAPHALLLINPLLIIIHVYGAKMGMTRTTELGRIDSNCRWCFVYSVS